MKQATAGVILAGGRGQRMGGVDKALLPLGGMTLIERVAARFPLARVISANGDAGRFAALGPPVAGLDVVADDIAGFAGPLAGVVAALDWAAAHDVTRIVTVATDTPFFPLDLPERLLAAAAPVAMAVVPRADASDSGGGMWWHPTFAAWDVVLCRQVRDALAAGEHRPRRIAELCGVLPVECSDPGAFFNINTPADLAEAARFSGKM